MPWLVLTIAAHVIFFYSQIHVSSSSLERSDLSHHLSTTSIGYRRLDNVNSPRPRIYIYEMPDKYHDWKKFGDVSDSFYGLDQLFVQLLKASPHWTNNTEEADYFYVDAWMYWPQQDMVTLIKELKARGPWWDRKGGADHIFVITADPGRCHYPQVESFKAIFLHHFGKLQPPLNRCDLDVAWGAQCDDEMVAAEAALFRRTLSPRDMCHIPGQDIVVPPTCYEPHPAKEHTQKFLTPYINKELQGVNRSTLLFYSGKIDLDADKEWAKTRPWVDAGYSFGARQTVYRMFKNYSGFSILDHHTHDSYWHRLSTSVYCLAAAGWGWGGRMKVSATRGCIPVIIQDGILVEFEEQLPMKEYAIRVPLWMVHKLPDILHTFIKSGRAAKMQEAMKCTWKLHWWRRPEGRAFEVVMCELKRRLLGKDAKISLNTDTCALDCGDGKQIMLNDISVNGV